MQIIKYLQGKKTYIVSLITALYGLSIAFGWTNFTIEQEVAIFIFLSALLGTTIKAGISRKK